MAAEFEYKILSISGKEIQLHLWDIAGQDRLGGISKLFCRGAAGAIVLSDIQDPKTLDNAIEWRT